MRWHLLLKELGPELHYIKGEHNIVADALSHLDLEDGGEDDSGHSMMMDCFAGEQGEDFPDEFPKLYKRISTVQQNDNEVKKLLQEKPEQYKKTTRKHGDHSYELVTCEDCIVLPKALQKKAVEWYHAMLLHPGETRMEITMAQHYTWKGMHKTVQSVCSRCQAC